ncbi:uncharacterized protein PAC_09371 [Phialocephala subalpina]|uniref:Uncharacterized protein n=1 Tax=Phialocephala subalpina TaxID=576137 RepID=A0A1L7X377_9HELO|nr:uncharacterized protein PAC_09371 [Phialocephala subalpina]
MRSSSSYSMGDASTLPPNEFSRREEANIVCNFIMNLPKRSTPSSDRVVIGVVKVRSAERLSRRLKEHGSSGMLGFFKGECVLGSSKVTNQCSSLLTAKPLSSTKHGLQHEIDSISGSLFKSKTKLILVVSPYVATIRFDVPTRFTDLTIIRCPEDEGSTNYLSINPRSTYCNIPIPRWDMREIYLDRELKLGLGVGLVADFMGSTSSFSSGYRDEIKRQTEQLQNPKGSWKERKSWVAGLLGLISGGSVGLYTCVNMTSWGVSLKCAGWQLGIKYASTTATLNVAGISVLAGGAAGVTVAALVYFVPWDSLFQWLKNTLSGIWDWLLDKFRQFSEAVKTWIHKRSKRRDRDHPRRPKSMGFN